MVVIQLGSSRIITGISPQRVRAVEARASDDEGVGMGGNTSKKPDFEVC